ncbi:MAG: response regulator transcription factor [Candidatus Solibacter usitatus]|nr:response regulator transcription factor [Candidatus Solibacter usitatus]
MTRILVVDDHPVVRSGLVSILLRQPDFQVAGEAADGLTAVAEYQRLKPHVVVLDLSLPGLDGWQALARIRELDPAARVLVISTFGGDEDVHRALEAGAKGYLLKESTEDEIVGAVRAVTEGRTRVSGAAAESMAERMKYSPLTKRELEVLEGMARGQSNKEIGWKMGVTESTIKGHVANIMSKLGVDDRTLAVTLAIQRGLIRLPKP